MCKQCFSFIITWYKYYVIGDIVIHSEPLSRRQTFGNYTTSSGFVQDPCVSVNSGSEYLSPLLSSTSCFQPQAWWDWQVSVDRGSNDYSPLSSSFANPVVGSDDCEGTV